MTKIEKQLASRNVWVLDVQADGDKACDNELHVFSNEEACLAVFVEIYGERVHNYPCLSSSQTWDDGEDDDDYSGEDDDYSGSSNSDTDTYDIALSTAKEDKLRLEAMNAFPLAQNNMSGYQIKGYTFRVLKRRIIDEAAEVF